MTNVTMPIKLAFIIDDIVQDVLHIDERLAAILLSNPVIVDVTDLCILEDLNPTDMLGMSYDGKTFSRDKNAIG